MTTKNYTSLKISKQLKEAGFVAETDAWWDINSSIVKNTWMLVDYKTIVPAYSTQTLLDILKDHISEIRPCNAGVEVHRFVSHDEREYVTSDTLADALGKMVIELKNKKAI